MTIGVFVAGEDLAGRIAYAIESGKADAARDRLAELSKQDSLSPLFREVSKAVKPAVVEIRVTKWVRQPSREELFRRFFGDEAPFGPGMRPAPRPDDARPRRHAVRGLGSGVIVDAENGYILTNNHVVDGADEVEVVLSDDRKVVSEWVRTDRATDVAVVKIKPGRLHEAPLGDSDKLQVGDWVLAFGSPRGLTATVTAGIVSATGRAASTSLQYQDYIQTDAAINSGNSGGPLVNTRGEVVGLNNAISTRSGGNEGIGFSIPSNMIKGIMKQLVETGTVARGYLGVRIQDVDSGLAKSFNLPHTEGALVSEVADDTPAAKAGLKAGDFITTVNDRKVANVNELRNTVAAIAPGTKIGLKVVREGKTVDVPVTLGKLPDNLAAASGFDGPSDTADSDRFGLAVKDLTPALAREYKLPGDVEGVVVVEVDEASDAAEKGLEEGMVITHVGGKAVTSAGEFAKAIEDQDDGVRLRVRLPRGGQRFFFIKPEVNAD
jgi:serine protease Do